MQNQIRVLVIDDERMFRDSIARAIGATPGFTVVGCCGSISGAVDLLRNQVADVVLLDYDLGAERGTAFLPLARAKGFAGNVVVLTADLSVAEGAALVRQGVSGICLKSEGLPTLIETLQLAVQGVTTIDERYFRAASEPPAGGSEAFSERERQIISYLMTGLSNKQIATRIAMSEPTVKAALRRIYNVTGVRSRGQLVCMLLEKDGSDTTSGTAVPVP